jgi:SAM-dependent methyltransferase
MRRNPSRRRRAPRSRPRGLGRDPYALYEAAVQAADFDLDFMERVYRSRRGHRFRLLREDFCATALLAAHWVVRRPGNRAWGVDLDPRPLAWCRRHRLPVLREAARRLVLLRRDVRATRAPRVDVIAALNFSYWVFKRRSELLDYFRAARRSLRPGGILVANAFGGTEASAELVETRRIRASRAVDGTPIGPFTYLWEHASFNAIDHHIVCHIHFRFPGGTRMERAFTYDWRLWTLPEIQEVMLEAGFRKAEVYVEGWDDKKNKADGVYRLRKRFTNQEGWLAYCVGLT